MPRRRAVADLFPKSAPRLPTGAVNRGQTRKLIRKGTVPQTQPMKGRVASLTGKPRKSPTTTDPMVRDFGPQNAPKRKRRTRPTSPTAASRYVPDRKR